GRRRPGAQTGCASRALFRDAACVAEHENGCLAFGASTGATRRGKQLVHVRELPLRVPSSTPLRRGESGTRRTSRTAPMSWADHRVLDSGRRTSSTAVTLRTSVWLPRYLIRARTRTALWDARAQMR